MLDEVRGTVPLGQEFFLFTQATKAVQLKTVHPPRDFYTQH